MFITYLGVHLTKHSPPIAKQYISSLYPEKTFTQKTTVTFLSLHIH